MNDEEKILLRKAKDLLQKSEKMFSAVYSYFLTPAQQMFLSEKGEFSGVLTFEGGYEDAERRLGRICTNEYNRDDGAPIILYSVRATDKKAELSHRDILGSLMGLGIKRETIGDIMTKANTAQFFCHESVAEFVRLNLHKIGHFTVEITEADFSEVFEPKKQSVSIHVSAMRLDCITGESFGISRTKAAEFIKKGSVSVNWQICPDVSREVKEGDKIAMRGKGKIELAGITGTSKKGRLFVDILKYV